MDSRDGAPEPEIEVARATSRARRSRRYLINKSARARGAFAIPDVIYETPEELAAVRRLASGMANDFNNILQVISGHAERLLQDTDSVAGRQASTQAIIDAARRASVMTRQLQAIGQRRRLQFADIDVSAVVADSVPALQQHLHARVSVSTHLSTTLPFARADREEIVEILLNLAAYANDHMPHGGTLTIATDMIQVGPQIRQLRPWLRPGRFVRLDVADSGEGLDAASLAHVFEPFYVPSTRSGSGLGLSAVHSAVKQLGGFIWIESERGQGTRVTILLPVAGDANATAPLSLEHDRVLLVEDDEGVRELLHGVLTHHGFAVAAYATAEEALEHREPFDLVLTDARLPGLSGPAMVREIRRRCPTVPILLMSGDPVHALDIEGLTPKLFLQKPFSSQVLLAGVRDLLSA